MQSGRPRRMMRTCHARQRAERCATMHPPAATSRKKNFARSRGFLLPERSESPGAAADLLFTNFSIHRQWFGRWEMQGMAVGWGHCSAKLAFVHTSHRAFRHASSPSSRPSPLAIHSQARQPSENGGLDLRVLGRRQRRDAQPSWYCRWATLLREGRVSLALLRHLGRSFGCRGRRSRKVTKPPKGPVVPKRLPHRAKPTQGRGPSSCWACQAVSHAFPTTSWSSAPSQSVPPNF